MQVSRLLDMINYQDDSVVSKEIIKKEAGTLTLFAFDKGQGLSEHTAPFDALVNILDGQAEVTISGKPFVVKEGEMIIMPANKPHSIQASERFKMLLVLIKKWVKKFILKFLDDRWMRYRRTMEKIAKALIKLE